jgi:hypothetical protein
MDRLHALQDMGAMGRICLRHSTAPPDAESAEGLENLKALLK